MKRNLNTMVFAIAALSLAGLLAGCESGPSKSDVETINSEIKAKQKSDLPPVPPPTDAMPAAPGSFKKGSH